MTYLPVDVLIDQKTKLRLRIDTLNLLAYVVLLVFVLVTTWFFKRCAHNRSYLHETGLAIIYGLVMGAAMRYFGLDVTPSSIPLEDKLPRTAPADYITILSHNLGDKNITNPHVYAYEFRGEIRPDAKLGSQISYALVDPEVFFNIILPPIVLNAGLSLKRRHFFRNIGAIFSYAFLGTTISVATVGSLLYASIQALKHYFQQKYLADQFSLANCLYFGAIISPTDPIAVLAIFQELGVDLNLFALVFGESILNDAVSIVLTQSIEHFSVIGVRDHYSTILRIIWECLYNFLYMFLASCAIGVVLGIITAITTKFSKLTESPLLESSLVVLMSYLSFLTAEAADTSGIVAILMCGITQAHYTINNLSFEARDRLKSLFEMLTFLCENFLFLNVGVSFWQRGQTWDLSFIGLSFVAITVARALSVYPLSCLLNLGRRHKIPANYQHLIAWGGGARGVISYSLAARNTVGDARRIMLSTTSVIVIVTVILVGGAVGPLLKCLKIPFGKQRADTKAKLAKINNDHCAGDVCSLDNQQRAHDHDHNEDDYNEDHDDDNTYLATNNPAWIVRPKRLYSLRWSLSCPCVEHHHQSQNYQRRRLAHDSALVPVAGTSAESLVVSPHGCYCQPTQRHRQRCGGRMSQYSTPVLKIEPAPRPDLFIGGGNVPSHRQANGAQRTCSCDYMIDSRTASSSSVDHELSAGGQLLVVSSALMQPTAHGDPRQHSSHQALTLPQPAPLPPPPTVAEEEEEHENEIVSEIVSATNADMRTGSTQALTEADGRDLVDAHSSLATIDRSIDEPNSNGDTLISSPYENASLVRRWRYIDNYFIKPLLTNSHPTLLETMPSSLSALARIFTSEEQLMRQHNK